ncbi:MAG TPA: carbamoyltransferase, partial [Flavobacteriales bacterium]|nr:carbamoyltransferase [Flavobacteriales bacterium]
MYILGLNTYHGDSSAALLKDGELMCAYEEERFTRFKHWAGLPLLSIRACLTDAGISIQDIDHITISRDPSVNKKQKIFFALKNRIKIKALIHRSKHISKVATIGKDIAIEFGLKEKELKPEVHYLEHHCTHMASSFFASPFNDSAILSIDGFGDFCSTKTGIGNDNKMTVLDSVLFPHSVGIFYTALTQYLGFNNYGDEYKVMGLAPYGKPIFLKEMEKIIMLKSNGLFQLGLDYFVHHKAGVSTNIMINNDPTPSRIFSDNLIDLLGPLRKKEEKLEEHHLNIASSIQVMTENIIFHMLNHLQEKTKMENICIAGGVAQNSVANGKILQKTGFKRIYIPSASHDAGTSYGSAIYYHNQVLGNKRADPVFNAYTGSKFTEEEIQELLDKKGIEYKVYDDAALYDVVSQKMVDGGVIGWFQGRAEFGP